MTKGNAPTNLRALVPRVFSHHHHHHHHQQQHHHHHHYHHSSQDYRIAFSLTVPLPTYHFFLPEGLEFVSILETCRSSDSPLAGVEAQLSRDIFQEVSGEMDPAAL